MAVHSAWPPLATLAMFVMVIAFIILKYGDRLCKARSVPRPQNYEIESQSSENTQYVYDEGSMREYIEVPEIQESGAIYNPENEKTPLDEKYEIAV